MWQGETAGLQAERYRSLVVAALPARYATEDLTSHQATWLWRTLRAAESAGLDVSDVVRQAIDSDRWPARGPGQRDRRTDPAHHRSARATAVAAMVRARALSGRP